MARLSRSTAPCSSRATLPINGFRQYAFAWGSRTDVELHPRLVAIAELYDIDAGHATWQAGLRTRVRPERLILDLTYGDQLRRGRGERPGWIIGVGWTPPPILR